MVHKCGKTLKFTVSLRFIIQSNLANQNKGWKLKLGYLTSIDLISNKRSVILCDFSAPLISKVYMLDIFPMYS